MTTPKTAFEHRDHMRNVFQEMLTSLQPDTRAAVLALRDLYEAELAVLRDELTGEGEGK